jgi:O2-independent ubiquinone biosynthesis protein UbiV
MDLASGLSRLRDWTPDGLCDGYWTGQAGIATSPAGRSIP